MVTRVVKRECEPHPDQPRLRASAQDCRGDSGRNLLQCHIFACPGGSNCPFPCHVRAVGRVAPRVIPAVELATIVHEGSHPDIDLAYGSLATYVAEHTLAVEEDLREYYLVGPQETSEESAWRTEIGWPIFQTG